MSGQFQGETISRSCYNTMHSCLPLVQVGSNVHQKRVLKAYNKRHLEVEKERDGLNHATVWYELEILSKIGPGCDAIPVVDEAMLRGGGGGGGAWRKGWV